MNMPFTVKQLAEALGPEFLVKEQANDWIVTRPDATVTAWVDRDPPAVRGLIIVFLPEEYARALPADCTELKAQACELASAEFRRAWKRGGFSFPESADLASHQGADQKAYAHYELRPSKPVTSLGEAVTAIKWLAGRDQPEWVNL